VGHAKSLEGEPNNIFFVSLMRRDLLAAGSIKMKF